MNESLHPHHLILFSCKYRSRAGEAQMMRSPRLFLRFVLRSLLFHPLIDESPHPHQSYCLANVQESEDLEKNGEDDTPNGGDIGEEGEKLEVDELLDVGEDKKTGEPIWFCKWKGYDGSRNTWEPRHFVSFLTHQVRKADSMYKQFCEDKQKTGEVEKLLDVREEVGFLILHDVISSEGIIADEMYKKFLEDQKKARAAIFSKRAARATKKTDGGGPKMQVRGRFLGFTEIAEAVHYLIFCAPFPSGTQ
mmetsp:Transcript_31742/g.67631  ORF Transcript_31742/g.67631 Transcript_31742/m.67631 type:complete len:249 (-) Transcript_31742:224-970(-)